MRVGPVDSYEERCLVNRVVVLGSINRDFMLTLDRLPAPGETVTASGMQVLSGGKGANQAVAAAAIGGSVALVGRVGTDAAGPEQVSSLAAAGVDVTFVEQDPRAPTGTAVVMVDGAGHNSIAVVPGANGLLDAASVEMAGPVIAAARILLLQLEIPAAAVELAVSIARRAGVLTVLNIAPYRDVPAAVLSGVDYLLRAFGGMGSLNDLLIHEANGHSIAAVDVGPVNDRLDELRTRVY